MGRAHWSLNRRRWAAARKAALDRDGWRCRRCQRPGVLEVHHVQPLEEAGEPYDLENLETLCRRCHLAHHAALRRRAREDAPWAAMIEELM